LKKANPKTKQKLNTKTELNLLTVNKWFIYLCRIFVCRSSSASALAKRKFPEPEPQNVTELPDAISLFTEC